MTATEALERRIDELCRENEQLRLRHKGYVADLQEAVAENAKLRELVAEIYEDQCDGSERWRYRDRMRKLGIEVDG